MRHKYSSSLAFNDLLFNVLVGFVFLFIIAFLLINPPTKTADIPAKAEFMVMLEWTDELNDDIDLWVQFDDTAPIGYKHKTGAGIALERDDLGESTDRITINGKDTVLELNNEMIMIRGITPGDYYVGLHVFNKRTVEPVTTTVTVAKINPYRIVYSKTMEITQEYHKHSFNLPGFTIDDLGKVTDIFEHTRNLGPHFYDPNTTTSIGNPVPPVPRGYSR